MLQVLLLCNYLSIIRWRFSQQRAYNIVHCLRVLWTFLMYSSLFGEGSNLCPNYSFMTWAVLYFALVFELTNTFALHLVSSWISCSLFQGAEECYTLYSYNFMVIRMPLLSYALCLRTKVFQFDQATLNWLVCSSKGVEAFSRWTTPRNICHNSLRDISAASLLMCYSHMGTQLLLVPCWFLVFTRLCAVVKALRM